jgi:hypothetical protein
MKRVIRKTVEVSSNGIIMKKIAKSMKSAKPRPLILRPLITENEALKVVPAINSNHTTRTNILIAFDMRKALSGSFDFCISFVSFNISLISFIILPILSLKTHNIGYN